jgi:hypothetical protein
MDALQKARNALNNVTSERQRGILLNQKETQLNRMNACKAALQ